MTEDQLEGARRLDQGVLANIYDQYSPGLYRYAMRLLGDPYLAEDCVSDTFSRFLKALKAGKGPKDYLQAYLYRIAHNWITDQYRRQPEPPLMLDEELSSSEEMQVTEQVDERIKQERVRSALRLLTSEQRQVIVLKYLEGWKNEEVAVALQKPVGAVKALQHRALAALRRILVLAEADNG